MTAAAVAGRWASAGAHGRALMHNLRNLANIRKQRRIAKQIRKKSDKEIFRKVMRTPRLDYFLKTFQGRLAEYED
jgi:hypothetical protein